MVGRLLDPLMRWRGRKSRHPNDDGQTSPLMLPGSQSVVIRVRGFRKEYWRKAAVDGVDLDVPPGEIYGLIGPDGAGKSSLMKAIAGVLTYEGGSVEVYGVSIDSERAAERVKGLIGFMPQGLGLNLYPDLSVEENIDFFARLRLVPEAELACRKQRLLAMTRLEKFRGRPMKQLSGGMKQKLGLVCTLIHEPRLVILDEPTTGVDPISRRDFWAILALLLREQRTTALVSTAYLDEASRFHQLSLLDHGRVLAAGEPREIERRVPGCLVTLRADPQVEALKRLGARLPHVQALGPWVRSFVDEANPEDAAAQVRSLLEGLTIRELYTGEPELEDVFVALLRREQDARPAAAARWSVEPSTERRAPGTKSKHAVIEAAELTRDFGSFRAVDRVSFGVPQGEIFGLLGANGAGKTTVIKMLTGLLPPTGGQGYVAGRDTRTAGQALKRRIGYMSQAFSLYQDLTVVENIRLYAGIYGLTGEQTRQRLKWILEMGGLDGHQSHTSGSLPMGLRQRLALGCALIHRPHVLFLDEPTSGVDPIGRRRFWDILFHLSREEGVAILVTTHSMSEAEHCDHLALMYGGRIVADAPPEEMKRQVETEAGRILEVTTDQPTRALDLLTEHGFPAAALFGHHVHLLSQQGETDRERIARMLVAAGIRVDAITPRPLSMEDVFIYRVTELERQDEAAAGGSR